MPGPLDILRQLGLNLPPSEQSQPLQQGENMPGSGPKWIDPAIEGLLGAIGVGPDTRANRFGQLLTAASPIARISRGQRAVLSSNKGLIKPPAVSAIESPNKVVLEELFASNPAAKEAYERAMQSQIGQVMEERAAAQPSKYSRAADAHDALLDLSVADRPRPIPTETGWEIAIPTSRTQRAPMSAQSSLAGPSQGHTSKLSQTPSGFESKFSGTLAKEAAAKPDLRSRLVKKPKSE